MNWECRAHSGDKKCTTVSSLKTEGQENSMRVLRVDMRIILKQINLIKCAPTYYMEVVFKLFIDLNLYMVVYT